MTVPPATTGAQSASSASYEELRRRVLAGTALGGSFGLVVLLREGVVAWMGGLGSRSVSVDPTASSDQRAAPLPVSNEIHAGIVRVLASMALSGRQEPYT